MLTPLIVSLSLALATQSDAVRKEVVPAIDNGQRKAIVEAANEAIKLHLRSPRPAGVADIPPALWGEAIAALKPRRVYNDRVNVAIVLADDGKIEEGLYVSIPISSYAPTIGDRFTLLETLSQKDDGSFGQLLHYKLPSATK